MTIILHHLMSFNQQQRLQLLLQLVVVLIQQVVT